MAPQRPEVEVAVPRLLELIRELQAGLHPRGRPRPVTLESSLERDLGLDSLGRTELLHKVEAGFGVRLPEQLLVTAETLGDVLRALLAARPGGVAAEELRVAFLRAEPAGEVPAHARTLVEVLEWHAASHPDRVHVHLQTDAGEVALTYRELLTGASEVAAGLQARGLQPGETVAVMLPTGVEYLEAFFGALLAGLVPVPIYPPFRPSQLEEHLRRQAGILRNARASLLVSVPEVRSLARLLQANVESLRAIETVTALRGREAARLRPHAEDVAFLQYTSGSTGSPKGVVLTHANLLANIRAMGEVARVGPGDVFVSWLPLYHDMGLIGAWLGSLYYRMPLVLLSPLQFLARPERWLWALHRYRGTLSAAPNFAYEICARRLKPEVLEGLELGSWRMAVNGAEPVSPETLEHFAERFRSYGFKREALAPVYGLAESSVGLAFPPPGRGPVIDRVRREALLREGRAVVASPEDPDAVRMVACGQPLPGHQLRIVDAWGRELPERQVGRLEFRGPSCTSGYFRNPEATRGLFRDGWLDSGDLAYLAGGDVYVTGRVKDVIIRGGRNVYPYELEEAIGDVPGIRKGCVAVIGVADAGTERLVVIAETREDRPEERKHLVQHIRDLTIERLGEPPDEVVLAPPHAVLKTSSGKIRRSATRELYERGELAGGRAVWLQVASLGLAGLGPGLRRGARNALDVLYSAYAWLVFWLVAPVGWLVTVLLPRRSWRRGFVKALCRLLLRLYGLRVFVHGREHLAGCPPCVLVANHASYFDAIVLMATMPPEMTYVAKREFARHWLTRIPFDRLGVRYVERQEAQRAIEDARALLQPLRAGDSLFVFAEGGFVREPGLRPFRLGAFVVAAEAGVPVVPMALRGTRSLLRARSKFVRRGAVHLTIEQPIRPTGRDLAAAARLRDAAYEAVLLHSGELALERGDPG